MLNLKIKMFGVCVLSCGYSFSSISGRGNECSPGNSNLDVFLLFYTFSCCFLGICICQQKIPQSECKSGYLVKMNKNDLLNVEGNIKIYHLMKPKNRF